MDLHGRGLNGAKHYHGAGVGTDGDNGVKFAAGPRITPKHDPAYWGSVTAGFDFSEADQVPRQPNSIASSGPA
jgi:hypothetical protein